MLSQATTSDGAADAGLPTDINAVLQFLPACKRCRSAKKRCDTRLPACGNCCKSGEECAFFDHVLNRFVSREYVASMVARLNSPESTGLDAPSSSQGTMSLPPIPRPCLVYSRGSYRALGRRASLALPISASPTTTRPLLDNTSHLQLDASSITRPSPWMHQFLVSKYMEVIDPVYPVLDRHAAYLQEAPISYLDLSPAASFNLNMLYSIACHCLPCNDTRLLLLSDTFFKRAVIQTQRVTAELSLEALQAVMLLTLRSQFDSQSGNIGQLATFANRLATELNARGIGDSHPTLSLLRMTIYSLGTQIACALDRPSDTLESDVTLSLEAVTQAHFVCSLYMMQSRTRSGNDVQELATKLSTLIDGLKSSPIAIATAAETLFLIQPSPQTALQLLNTYATDIMVLNVFTSHYVYKAATYILSHCSDDIKMEGYALSLVVLDRCASKWPSARSLHAAVRAYAQTYSTQSRG